MLLIHYNFDIGILNLINSNLVNKIFSWFMLELLVILAIQILL